MCISTFSLFEAVSWPTVSNAIQPQRLFAPVTEGVGKHRYHGATGESLPFLHVLLHLFSWGKACSIKSVAAYKRQRRCHYWTALGGWTWQSSIVSNNHLGGYPTSWSWRAGRQRRKSGLKRPGESDRLRAVVHQVVIWKISNHHSLYICGETHQRKELVGVIIRVFTWRLSNPWYFRRGMYLNIFKTLGIPAAPKEFIHTFRPIHGHSIIFFTKHRR